MKEGGERRDEHRARRFGQRPILSTRFANQEGHRTSGRESRQNGRWNSRDRGRSMFLGDAQKARRRRRRPPGKRPVSQANREKGAPGLAAEASASQRASRSPTDSQSRLRDRKTTP